MGKLSKNNLRGREEGERKRSVPCMDINAGTTLIKTDGIAADKLFCAQLLPSLENKGTVSNLFAV